MRPLLLLRRYVHGLTHGQWACEGGPCCGETLPVSRLAALTTCALRMPGVVETEAGGRRVTRDYLEAAAQHSLAAGWHWTGCYVGTPGRPWYHWEPTALKAAELEVLRDHKTDGARKVASWDYVRDLRRVCGDDRRAA